AVGEKLMGIERPNISRRQPPQNAMHRIAPAWCDRAPAIEADENSVPVEHSRAERSGARTAPPHRRAMHIGAIGKIKRHPLRIPDLGCRVSVSEREQPGLAIRFSTRSRAIHEVPTSPPRAAIRCNTWPPVYEAFRGTRAGGPASEQASWLLASNRIPGSPHRPPGCPPAWH